MKQWFLAAVKLFELEKPKPAFISTNWSQNQNAYDEKNNISIYYRSHGPPLHSPGPRSTRPYITNTLDNITNGGDGTIVLFTIGLHFELFHPSVFVDRIKRIKHSVVNLISRIPGLKIFVKGFHSHVSKFVCPSPWLSYRYDFILRNKFRDVDGVTYISIWDAATVLNNENLHPQSQTLKKLLAISFAHVC